MKTFVYVGASLDGYIARTSGDISWLAGFENKEVTDSYNTFILGMDAIVIGRGTYETVLTFPHWPYEKKVFLLSTTVRQVPETLIGKLTVLSMKPGELRKYLSDNGFSSIYIDGGKVIQDFLKEDYIDELIITRVPLLLGSGIPLFGYHYKSIAFTHVRTDVYSNGLVKSHYERISNN
jgi:dihydrofolate reductase